jgi:hypothetical protein
VRNDEECDDKCECVDCKNPLNPEEVERLIKFATETLEKYEELLKPPTIEKLQNELNRLLMAGKKIGASAIEVNSEHLYHRVSRLRDDEAMEVCCKVMRENMKDGDKLIKKQTKDQLITIEYKLK